VVAAVRVRTSTNMQFPIYFVSFPEGVQFFLSGTIAGAFAKEKAFGAYGNLKNHVKLCKINICETLPNFFSNQDDYVIEMYN
jgi:hypothetical protein